MSRRNFIRFASAAALAAFGGDASPIVMRPVPRTGERLPVIGLGTWQTFDVGAAEAERGPLREVLRLFVEHGGAVVDSSPMYGRAETVLGALAAELAVRPRLFIATKVWTSGREAGIRQMEESLRRLRVGTVDLMQVHNLVDWRTHLATLRRWKEQGRVRYIGVTHYSESAYGELERVLRAEELDFLQVNYSVAERAAERRLLPLAVDRAVAVLVNRPFAQAALFDRVRGVPLPPWTAEYGCRTWAQLFLKFVVSHPAVTCAIPATRRSDHLLENLRAGTPPLPDARGRNRIARALAEL